MYHIRIAGELAFDALWDGSTVASASISQAANAAAYLDMTLAPSSGVSEGDEVTVDWDGEALFAGTVTEVSRGIDGTVSASAVSGIDRLSGALVPPHSTDGSVGVTCPDTRAAYVQWLAQAYNGRSMGGYRVDVGENQADRLTEEPFAVSEPGWASVAQLLDDHVLSLGAHLEWGPREGGGTLSIWADLHEAADQLIDLGVNVTDIKVTRTLEGRRTAVVPRCGSEGGEMTLSDPSGDAAAIVANAGLMLAGGAIYDPGAVAEWGWSEEAYDVAGATSDVDLARAGVPRLRTLLGPSVTVEVRAVDAALYDPSVGHLRMGQAARVRAGAFDVDEYLAMQYVALDLMDPDQTAYTLGVAYDTLTGRQSTFLRQMNASIDHSLDLIGGVSAEVGKVAGDLVAVGDRAEEALDKATDAITGLGGVAGQVTDLGAEVEQIRKDAEEAGAKADKAAEDAADALRQAQETVEQVTADVAEAKEAAQAASDKADGYAQQVADATATVNGVKQDVSELTTKVEGAAKDAAGALTAATEAKQTATEVSTTAERAYEDAQSALSQSSRAVQTATGVKTALETEYVSKADASSTYSTKAEVEATSSKLSASVTEAAETAEAAQEKALEVEATASGLKTTITQVSSKADAAQKDADAAQSTADGAVKQVTTLKATVDGVSSAVTKAQSTADSAVSAASKAQQTVDGFKTEVSQKYQPKGDYASKGDLSGYQPKGDYATSSEVEQSATQIRQQVADTYATKTALDQERTDRQSAITQSATQVKSEVSNTYLKKTDASTSYATKASLSSYATKSSVDQTASQIKSEVAAKYATQEDVDGISVGGTNLLMYTAYDNLSGTSVRGSYATLSRDTSNTYQGRTSLKLVASAASVSGTKDAWQKLWSNLTVGDELVLSFWAKGSVAAKMWHRMGGGTSNGGSTAGTQSRSSSITTSWKRYEVSLGKVTATGNSGAVEVIYGFDKAGTFYLNGMKLEVGNRATDWSPAPEDMLSAADAAATYATKTALTQTEDSITAEVAKTYQSKSGMSSYATKSYVDQQDTSIRAGVTEAQSTAEGAMTKALEIEATASGLEVTLTETTATANSALSKANAAKFDSPWVICETAAATAAKTVSVGSGFRLVAGATITVRFTNGHTASTMTMNVNGTGAKAVYASGNHPPQLNAQSTVTMVYSGATWTMSDCGSLLNSKNAAKTATNFLRFDSSGLCVGNMTGTLGYNALITSSQYQIRNGSTVLSSFGASTVELGKNSTSARIRICGGEVDLSYNTANDDLSISKTTSVNGSVFCTQLATSGVLNVGGNMWLGLGQRTKIRGFYQGSKVVTVSATSTKHVLLFTNSQYTTIVGREYKVGDVILVCNGDYEAKPRHTYGTTYRGDNKNWYVCIESGDTGSMRVNYLIVAVA